MTDEANDKRSWFLIHTRPRQEDRACSNLRAWQVETFSPQVRQARVNQFTGERTHFVKPLFSRYIFARFNLERLFHKVLYTRGVHELVSFGDGPIEVDESIIAVVRARIGKDGFVGIGEDLKPGHTVMIKDGILKNFTGIFEREMQDSDRVELLLNTVSYQARVQIERNLLRKLDDVEYRV
jgi:transcriptional antiterminator RfaH